MYFCKIFRKFRTYKKIIFPGIIKCLYKVKDRCDNVFDETAFGKLFRMGIDVGSL
ncbi:hypothetical protein D3C78_989720 [compost metagenome]